MVIMVLIATKLIAMTVVLILMIQDENYED